MVSRARSLLVIAPLALAAAGCVTVVGGPTAPAASTAPPGTPEPSLVPVVTAAPTPAVTLEPGATPSFDIASLLNADLTIFNLSDADLSVSAVIHDTTSDGEDVPISAFTLGPGQVAARALLGGDAESGAVPYLLTFSYPSGAAATGGTCTISVLAGQDFTFVAVNEGLTVNRGSETPATLDEALIATSSLCVPPPAPTATP